MRFSFHRGGLALDLVGTVGRRASDAPEERLPDPAALADWLREAGLPAPARVGEGDLARAKALREALWRAGLAALAGRSPERADARIVNEAARGRGAGALQLDGKGGAAWRAEDPLALSLGRIAEDGILRLTEDRDRLARCALDGCGALLLSRSRSEPRRWCSMETCGNRAKAAAFRTRARGGGRA